MNERLKILEMLHNGRISVDEASQLLEAVSRADRRQSSTSQSTAAPGMDAEVPAAPPDMTRFRRLSYIPLIVSLVILILSGWGAYALFLGKQGAITFGFVALVGLGVLAFLATALALWATTVPWLHVRIRSAPSETDAGRRIAISLPVPLTLTGWGLRIANRFVDTDTAGHLDAAATLIATMRHTLGEPGAEPIVVDVNDEDDRVQIYIG